MTLLPSYLHSEIFYTGKMNISKKKDFLYH